MGKTNIGLIEYALEQLGKPYWFGTFGQTASSTIYNYNKSRFPSYYTAKDFTSQYGLRVHDCAGLIKGYLWSDSPTSAPKYCSGGYPDISANQMKLNCTETGSIDTIPELPGVLVFLPSHVGIYLGNGLVVEARGHAYGVVITKLKDRNWTSWGKFKYIEYSKEKPYMQYIGNATVKIYVNAKKKTCAQIKAETGCTALVNAGLFNMTTFKPIAQLKVEGNVLASENWGTNYGMAWNDSLTMSADMSKYNNFIGCICLVKDSKAVKLSYPADMGGARPRTAFGVMPDGKVWLYASKANQTPETLQQVAIASGVTHAIMLDGGGSTQCSMPEGTITSSRIVHNYICVYENKPSSTKPTTSQTCPYAEPTANIQYWGSSANAKWVQWQLKRKGYKGKDGKELTVDGVFGANSIYALKELLKS